MRRITPILLAALTLPLPALAQLAKSPADTDHFAPLLKHEVLFNGWGLSPAGTHVSIGSIPLKMLVAPDGKAIIATSAGAAQGLSVVDPNTKTQTQFLPLPRTFNGLAFSLDGKTLFATGGNSSTLHVFAYADGKLTLTKSVSLEEPDSPDAEPAAIPQAATTRPKLSPLERRAARKAAKKTNDEDLFFTGLATHPTNGDLYLCAEGSNEIWVVDTAALTKDDAADLTVKSTIRVGTRPYTCLFGADKRHLYVSNWGDRALSVVDTQTARLITTLNVGIRPNDMTLAPDGRLFVACAGDNTIHVVQTRAPAKGPRETDQAAPPDESALEIISTALYPQSPEGSTPVGVAVSNDGKFLFAVNADNNDALVADISDTKLAKVLGFVPTGWYPTAVTSWNNQLIVGVGKGLSSRENFPPRLDRPAGGYQPNKFDAEARILEGRMSFINPTGTPTLGDYTAQVKANSPYTPDMLHRTRDTPANNPIPSKIGTESPIKHIVYVIKENRTYDQVFGAFTDANGKPAGNGDPKLTLFGESITPNQHRLAREFVLFDNFYCNSEVSVDGHSWTDAGIATDGNQKSWITSYTQHGKLPVSKDIVTPAGGYIWDLCKRAGIPFKCYGEGANQVPNENRGTWSKGRDPEKVDAFLKDLATAEKTGTFPNFMILSLGENHTKGTTPGAHTPAACVASNDLAVGKLIEGLSKSKFWNETAVFIVEDDAQNGPDHVDSHRTCALVISPYTRRGIIDSTQYTQVSMLRTIELILALPPLTQHDAGATPMFNAFAAQPSAAAYAAVTPKLDMNEKNTKKSPGAAISAKMDFDDYDDAPEDPLNRVLWLAMKGPNIPYPTPVRRAILPIETP